MEHQAPQVNREALSASLARQPDVVAAYLFGSTAHGRANRLSDVDIAVLLESDPDPEASIDRQVELMVALDEFADREVQVTILNRAPPLLAYQATRDGVLLYERNPSKRIAFEVHAMKSYLDIQPMLRFYRQVELKQIEETGQVGHPRRDPGTIEAARRIHERLARPAGR